MVNNRLVKWLKENQKKGYSLSELRNILIKNKNNPQEIEDAIKFIQNKPKSLIKKKIINKKTPKKKISSNYSPQKKQIQRKQVPNKQTPKRQVQNQKIQRPFRNFNIKKPIQKKTQKEIINKKTPKKKISSNYSPQKKQIPKKQIPKKQAQNQKVSNNKLKNSGSNKKIWIISGISILFIILLIIGLFFIFSSGGISEDELSQGTRFELKQDKEIKFNLDDEEHSIKVNSVQSDSVSLTIQSNPINIDINKGEEEKIDLDNNDYYDLLIRLESIQDNVPEFYIKKINEIKCTEDWNCTNWSDCSKNETQTRECIDLNDCGTEKNKPSLTQYCEYTENCTEDWECENWSECINETQTRECVDLNECGTIENKPSIERDCEIDDSENDTQEDCTEDWDCTDWSECIDGTQNRTCTDLNDCNTTEDKPSEEQECEEPLECLLDISSNSLNISNGSNSTIYVEDFENSSKINWIIENDSVISLNSTTGYFVEIRSLKIGLTNLTAIDTNIDSECNVTSLINITSS
ncbi:MAG: hypothetical protein ACOC3Z_00725 [Nanoarchaeota archaeon]